MNSKVVVFIESNPIESHRPSEGIRIALGLAACNHSVDIILVNQAIFLLTAIENIIDNETIQRYLSELKESIPAFFIYKESIEENNHIMPEYNAIYLSRDEMAKKIATATCFIKF